jgi:hypothetical protein
LGFALALAGLDPVLPLRLFTTRMLGPLPGLVTVLILVTFAVGRAISLIMG